MKSSLFPDVNVWLAATHRRHTHNSVAADWINQANALIYFCRLTQLGFLRLLTTKQVMGKDVSSQTEALKLYDSWRADERVGFQHEPDNPAFESLFRKFSGRPGSSPKVWSDAYLLAFAVASGLRLVTFDQAVGRIPEADVLVLEAS